MGNKEWIERGRRWIQKYKKDKEKLEKMSEMGRRITKLEDEKKETECERERKRGKKLLTSRVKVNGNGMNGR